MDSSTPTSVDPAGLRVPRLRHQQQRPATTPSTTIGTLIRKTEPHQKCSSSAPPTTGPIATRQADGAGPDADGLAPLARVEDVGDDRQRRRHDRRAADAHQRPGPDQLAGRLGVRRQPATPGRTATRPMQQDPPAAEPVAEHAEGEQQPGEDQRVRVDGPLEFALAGAEPVHRVGDGPQRDVEDGVVEHDDEQADDEHAEDRPAPRVSGVVRWLHVRWLHVR